METPLEISIERSDDTAIVRPKGKLTIGAGDIALRETIMDLSSEGIKKVVIDLAEVKRADSSGIGELVSAYTALANSGGRLVLVNAPSGIRDILEITRLIEVFDVAPSVRDGLLLLKES